MSDFYLKNMTIETSRLEDSWFRILRPHLSFSINIIIYNKGAFSSVQAYIYDSAMANATPTKLGSRGCLDLAALRRIFLS